MPTPIFAATTGGWPPTKLIGLGILKCSINFAQVHILILRKLSSVNHLTFYSGILSLNVRFCQKFRIDLSFLMQ